MKKKKNTRTIYHVGVELFGEQDFFLDENGEVLACWDLNDAHYRREYMNPLFEKLGISVEEAEFEDPRFCEKIKECLREYGWDEED